MSGLNPDAAFDGALSALPPALLKGPVGVAVSGGSDSLALLIMAARWAEARKADLAVLTVNHGLRAGAAAEAAAVAAHCARLGVPHRTLTLEGLAPRQTALRRARHAALATALREAGGRLLLTGHTAEDQAETFLIRARQGSGWYGLAGMRELALSPVWPEGAGVWIARPLITHRRLALRYWLTGQAANWAEDPSNEDPAFERVRMRQMLQAAPALHARILACQQDLARLRVAEDRALARWLQSKLRMTAAGLVAEFNGLPPERAARALGFVLQAVAGRETPPRSDGLARLATDIVNEAGFRGATLGGARLSPVRGGVDIRPERVSDISSPPGWLAARLALQAASLAGNSAEIDAAAGKESFLHSSVPIF